MKYSGNSKVLLLLLPVILIFLLSWQKSVTGDEALSVEITSGNWTTVVSSISADNHVPGWYGYLSIWIELFGTSLLSLRLSSLFIVLILVFTATRQFKSESVLILAFSPFLMHLALEIRMYGLLSLCGLFLLLALREFRRTPGVRTAVLVGLAISAGTWVHHFAWLGLPAALTIMIAGKKWKETAIVAGVPIILYLPWLSRALQQWGVFGKAALSGVNAYLPSISMTSRLLGIPFSLGGTLLRFSSGTAIFNFGLFDIREGGVWLIAGIICSLLILILVFRGIDKKSRIAVSILLWTLLPLSLLRPSARHFVLAFPAFIALTGNGLEKMKSKWKPAVYATLVLLLSMSIPLILRPTIPQRCTFERDFREAAAVAATAAEENSIPIVVNLDLYSTLGVMYHIRDEWNADAVIYHPHGNLLNSRTMFYAEIEDALEYLMVNTDSLFNVIAEENRDGFILIANNPSEARNHGRILGTDNQYIEGSSDIMADNDLIGMIMTHCLVKNLKLYNSSGPFSVFQVKPI